MMRSEPDRELPFTLRDLERALPAGIRTPSTARSLLHLALDLAALAALYGVALRLDSPAAWPFLWVAQGTLFWALFVLGHDCGHGSFSRHARLNTWVGHLLHTPLLVPYHGWRISHRIHHRHVGNLDRDDAWVPLTEAEAREASPVSRWLRFRGLLLVFPLYLLRGTPLRGGSHFHPRSPLFSPAHRRPVATSSALCGLFAVGLVGAAVWLGPVPVLRHWLGPYLVFVVWIDLVTYLHHTDAEIPWYRDGGWSLLRGALSSVDRRYGWLDPIHHHAGLHLAHHLFPGIPHYRLRQATEAIRPVLGEHYRESAESAWRSLRRSLRECRTVPETGARVTYRGSAAG